MQLTKLKLQGFKSFVDPTVLHILPGLTGIVGPNGCGKSNLLEALRWVMGETRAKQMRGSGMEDVIFAGTDSRPAKHFAEVELQIDNKHKFAPAAFNHLDDIDVVRRITRDLGSAYKVNGKDVRARDVAMMFADAATGANSPSLVRQGQIAELINAKPANRRRILEDAAGISGLYQRRHEAELKLNSAAQNLTRVDDNIDALAAQLRSLERQARTATKYKEFQEELRAAEAILAYLRWEEAQRHFLSLENELKTLQLSRSRAERERLDAEKLANELHEKIAPLRMEEAAAAAVVQRLVLEKEKLLDEETRIHTSLEDAQSQLKNIEQDRDREEQIAYDAKSAIERLVWETDEISKLSEGFDEKFNQASQTVSASQSEANLEEDALEKIRAELAREEAKAIASKKRIDDANERLNRANIAHEKATKEANNLKAEMGEHEQFVAKIREQDTEIEKREAKEEQEVELLREQLEQARRNTEQEEVALAPLNAELRRLEGELNGVQRIVDRTMVGKKILNDINVTSGYEQAFAAAFDHDLDREATIKGTGWHQLSDIEPSSLPYQAIPLSQFISAPQVLSRRLSHIFLVDDLDDIDLSALLPGQRLVTMNGDFARWDGFVEMRDARQNASAQLLEARNRKVDLEKEIAVRLKEIDEKKVLLAKFKADRDAQIVALQALENQLQKTRQSRRESFRAVSNAEGQAERLTIRVQASEVSIQERLRDLDLANAEVKIANSDIRPESELEDLRNQMSVKLESVTTAREKLLDARATLDELRQTYEARKSRLKQVEYERSSWVKRLENNEKHKTELAGRHQAIIADIERLEQLPQQLADKTHRLSEELLRNEKRLNDSKEALAEAEGQRVKADRDFQEKEHALFALRESLARTESNLDNAKNDEAEKRQYVETNYEMQAEDLAAMLKSNQEVLPSAEELTRKIDQLSFKRDQLGAVNLRAEQDQIEVASEHDALIADKEEITKTIANLREAVASLNKEGRERLLLAFEEVNANFTTLFTRLFAGGDARLELIESDDPLQAGLEIMCQPPGKKLATLSLLSGGEQTLTAMALIFAVFLTNPSPVCVLDEVDAPLDDANVTLFCDLLDGMIHRTETRFLIITHHAVTMSRMDRLFGVTMSERGVSQLVSVDLKEAEELID